MVMGVQPCFPQRREEQNDRKQSRISTILDVSWDVESVRAGRCRRMPGQRERKHLYLYLVK